MSHDPHDLQLSILPDRALAVARGTGGGEDRNQRSAHLESLVLKDSLNRRIFTVWRQLCLKYYSKAAVPNNLTLCVLHFLCLAGNAILDFLPDDFCGNR